MDASASFIGGSYRSQSVLADCEELINWYVEQLQSPAATAKRVLYPTPGVETISSFEYGVGRAHVVTLEREFAVIGSAFIEIHRNGTHTNRGTVALDSNHATLSSSGDLSREILITSGGKGYIFNLDTNTLSEVVALAGLATMGAYLDGYFIILDYETSTVYCSDLGDGLTWDTGTNWAQRSASPDRWVSMKVAGRFLYLLGERTSEIWYNAGTVPFPFAFYEGAPLIQYGCLARFSPAVIGDDLIWVAISPAGRRCVVKASIQAQPISTYPIDTALEGYRNAVLAKGDVMSDRGHTFYIVGFDDANVTWVWDVDTGEWHKRMDWDRDTGQWKSWRPRYYANAFGQHRMLDSRGRSVFQVADTFANQADGESIRRLRRTPALTSGNDLIFYSSLELFIETGLASIEGTPPYAEFDWSLGEVSQLDGSASSTPVGSIIGYSWYINGVLLETTTTPIYELNSQPSQGDVITLVVTSPSGSASAVATIPLPPPYSGTSTPLSATGSDREPQVMLKMSNDAGRTWITEQWRGAGKLGQYQRRVRWQGLGSARRRVFEVSVSDPVPWRLVGADLRISQDVPAGERDRG